MLTALLTHGGATRSVVSRLGQKLRMIALGS